MCDLVTDVVQVTPLPFIDQTFPKVNKIIDLSPRGCVRHHSFQWWRCWPDHRRRGGWETQYWQGGVEVKSSGCLFWFQISCLTLTGVSLYDRQIVALVQIIRWGVGTTVIHSHWSRAIEILGSDWARSVLYDTVIRDFLWVGTVGTLTIKVTSTSTW